MRAFARFWGRVGFALRDLLTFFLWQPFLFITKPLRWFYWRVLHRPLRWLVLSLGRALRGLWRWLVVRPVRGFAFWLRDRWVAGGAGRKRLRRHFSSRWLVWRARLRVALSQRPLPANAVLIPRTPVRTQPTRRQAPLIATLVTINVVIVAFSWIFTQQQPVEPVAAAGFPTMPVTAVVDTPTAQPTQTATPLPTNAVVTATSEPAPLMPTWTPWPTPNPLATGGSVVFSMRRDGNSDIYVLTIGRAEPVRLTNHPADDLYPAWSPDGRRIAFSSKRDGNWELYTLNLQTGVLRRVTDNLAYDSAPSWSPDGEWLIYESYQHSNLDIYIIRADGSNAPIRLTEHPAPDMSPVWAPDGRHIAFSSWRGGNKDVYVMSLDAASDDRARNVTQSPDKQEDHPVFNLDGSLLAFDDDSTGFDIVYGLPLFDYRVGGELLTMGQGREPAWSPAGADFAYVFTQAGQTYLIASSLDGWSVAPQAFSTDGDITAPDWSAMVLPRELPSRLLAIDQTNLNQLYIEAVSPAENPPHYFLQEVAIDTALPFMNDRVDDSFAALRQRVIEEAGWDFLGRIDGMFEPIDTPALPGHTDRTWSKAGRAFGFDDEYALSFDRRIEIIRVDRGDETYWRIYLLADNQDGTRGEPLRELPWDFRARYGPDPQFYDDGGKYSDTLPTGYYVDFTALAADYGWTWVPSEANWRTFFPSILFWQYENHQGLNWEQAMLELYTPAELLENFGD
ncbi:MAG: PD40 domain-containing protein [Ardenticatenales bacterium]|nr:PD40 domain-containing protein [Ardenticatenales bacterium]